MSLVERALQKMHESRGASPPPPLVSPHAGAAASRHTDPVTEPIARPEPPAPVKPRRTVTINRSALQAANILPPQNQERVFADQYRHIKRPLIANALDRGQSPVARGRMIMITSALPGEGKTFTSINLAMSMAREKDISVLLLDADVANPRVSTIFAVKEEPGLLDLLRDETLDVESFVLPTDVPGLSILPAGKRSELAAELLASDRMQQTVEALVSRQPERIVLFDSPPLLLTSESRVLTSIVGQIVMVVRAGQTPRQAVLDAVELLGEDKPVGLVLNDCDEKVQAGYLGYYGYYGEAGDAATQQP